MVLYWQAWYHSGARTTVVHEVRTSTIFFSIFAPARMFFIKSGPLICKGSTVKHSKKSKNSSLLFLFFVEQRIFSAIQQKKSKRNQ
jgi:hypothetical protein